MTDTAAGHLCTAGWRWHLRCIFEEYTRTSELVRECTDTDYNLSTRHPRIGTDENLILITSNIVTERLHESQLKKNNPTAAYNAIYAVKVMSCENTLEKLRFSR